MKAILSTGLAALVLAACSKSPPQAPRAAPVAQAVAAASAPGDSGPGRRAVADAAPQGAIAWRNAASDADVEAAFALARAERKPVFLYWGAKWCPPCNQVKATLFNRIDFIERSRAFVPVYIDGDSPGAQRLGARFRVRGYPTMVLFAPDGTELTRLPGEADPEQVTQLLTLGMGAQRPVKAVLAEARRGGTGLAPNDWKLLAFYSWDTDEQRLVPESRLPVVLRQLARACPAQEQDCAAPLLLEAAAAAPAADAKRRPPEAATRERVLQLLADPAATRSLMDVLANHAADIVHAVSLPHSPERERLVGAYDQGMHRLQADPTLSRADRLVALEARVDLARVDAAPDARASAPLPAPLQAEVRETAARMDREITDGYERQAVITEAAALLAEAGLLDDSDALLQANLAKSHSPYYLMSQLAANAKKRGDATQALRWSREAFERSEGPATRLQWGASYVRMEVELAPQDEARIEATVRQLLEEAAGQADAFQERSARSLQRVGQQLAAWNRGQAHAAAVRRLHAQLDGVCARLPAGEAAQRQACKTAFAAAPAKPAA